MPRLSTDLSSDSTRTRLLATAMDLFLEKGYTGTGLRQICSACGVTTGAFYFFSQVKKPYFVPS